MPTELLKLLGAAFVAAQKLVWLLTVAGLVLTIAVGVGIGMRAIAKVTEFDRLGSDLNLYAFGVAIGLYGGILVDKPDLVWLNSHLGWLIVVIGSILNLMLYGANLYLSSRLRSLHPLFVDGLNMGQFRHAYQLSEGRSVIRLSVGLGLFPAMILLLADLWTPL